MREKINNIEFKGNRRFIRKKSHQGGQKLKRLRPLLEESDVPFGQLGTGILRPPKRPTGFSLPKPYKRPNLTKPFTPDGHLTDEEKLKRISDQVADSLQSKIDAALAQKKTDAKNEDSLETEEKPRTQKSKVSTGAKVFFVAGGLLAIGMIWGIATQFKFVNPKKA